MKKIANKFASVVAATVIAMTMMGTSIFAADPVVPPATPEPEAAGHAELYVKNIDIPIFTQGVNNIFTFTVGNHSRHVARNVKITAEAAGDLAGKFTIVQGSNAYYGIDYLGDDKRIETFLKIDASVPDGVYTLNLKFAYKNTDNLDSPVVTESCIIYVNGSSEAKPFVKSVSFDKAEIGKDNKAKMIVELVNPTLNTFNGVKLALKMGDDKSFTLYENFMPQYIPELAPKSTTKVEFSTYIAPSVVTGNYPVSFNLSYTDKDIIIHSYDCPVFAQVKRTADADGGKDGSIPRVIVSKSSADTKDIKAGKSFLLDFTLENTSNVAIGNMKVTVGSESVAGSDGKNTSAVFFASEGSNSFFIPTLGSKQSVSKQINLMAKQDVEPGVYPVLLTLEYEDASAKQFKSEERIAFNVSQEQRLEIVGLNIPASISTGMSIPVNFQYINKGKSTINNVSIAVDGDFTLEGGDMYIGNLTAGYNDYFDGMILPSGEGALKGAIILKFEDSQGNPKELRTDIAVEATPMDMSMSGDMGMGGAMTGIPEGMEIDQKTGELVPIKKGMPLWGIIGIIVAVLAVGAVVFLIIRKKLKAKKELKELMINEED